MTRLEILQNMPVFGGVDDDALQFLLDRATTRSIKAGDFFFRENDDGGTMFVLEQGEVDAFKSRDNAEHQLNRLGPGDCFGEMALIDLYPRSASVRARTDCIALEISHAALHALYAENIKPFAMIQMNMGREVSRRLRLLSDRLFSAGLEDKLATDNNDSTLSYPA